MKVIKIKGNTVEQVQSKAIGTHLLIVDYNLIAQSSGRWEIIERPGGWVCVSTRGSLVVIVSRDDLP